MRVLVAGWFSFERGHATAGDVLAKDVVCDWLVAAGIPHEVALAPFCGEGVDLAAVTPADYTHVAFVCGPFERGELEAELLGRFAACRLIGIDLSLAEPLTAWNPFDLLLERDSSAGARPDLVFASRQPLVPVVGVCLVESHPGAETAVAEEAIRRLLAGRRAAVVPIDTRLDANGTGLRDAAEVESMIARMDLVVTTRLHGMVLALKSGVPAVVIDPVPGGAKITRQAAVIGWPIAFTVDAVSDAALAAAFDHCLTEEARAAARATADRARRTSEATREELIGALARGEEVERAFRARLAVVPPAPVERCDARRPRRPSGLMARVRGRVLPATLRNWLGLDDDDC